MVKLEMGGICYMTIDFDPAHGDYRQVIIDSQQDVRICDGHSVVKVCFAESKIRDILQDDIFMKPVNLTALYQLVERELSHALQPTTRNPLQDVTRAREKLRNIMRELGFKEQF